MNVTEQRRFDQRYQRHLRMLKLQGLSDKTIDVYARAVRRVVKHFDCCPDRLTPDQLEVYFGLLVDSHSWSTVKVDRNGLQFFWRHVLKHDWRWVNIIKPPKIKTIPDVLTVAEVDRLIGAAQKTMKLLVSACGIKKSQSTPCGTVLPPSCLNAA
ncbi:MAG: phage integrase N-terminal SAM-like domain-containing protein [Desulfuromusa sp.]|nr:phage integrase N-terminal SAM-like domain-containing protein [Desulfuromusa sp.]